MAPRPEAWEHRRAPGEKRAGQIFLPSGITSGMSWQSKMYILSHLLGQVNHLPAIQLLLKDKRLRQFVSNSFRQATHVRRTHRLSRPVAKSPPPETPMSSEYSRGD